MKNFDKNHDEKNLDGFTKALVTQIICKTKLWTRIICDKNVTDRQRLSQAGPAGLEINDA